MRAVRTALFFAVACLFPVMQAAAQNTDIEALSGLQFNFGNPGARSLGMGGAFIALADDASAAEANPAGLTILRKPEVSIEARRTTIGQNFPTGGTYPYVTTADFGASQTAISFASAVFPSHGSVLAVYYHKPLSFRNRVDLTQHYEMPIYYLGPNGPVSKEQCGSMPNCTQRQLYPFSTSADVQMETFGIAVAHEWKSFSLGVGLRYQQFKESADTYRRDLDAPGQPVFVVAQSNSGVYYGEQTNKTASFVAGLKWKINSQWSVGGVYKQDASFAAPVSAGPSGGAQTLIGNTRFHMPATAGIGASYQPITPLTINADAIRVSYSHLTDNFISVIEYGSAGAVEHVTGYESANATEYHAGLEYFILGSTPVAIRAGWWRDPAHAITYRGPVVTAEEVAAKILFPGTKDENHYSVGLGIAFPKFQIDAAYDHAETLKTASISMIARF